MPPPTSSGRPASGGVNPTPSGPVSQSPSPGASSASRWVPGPMSSRTNPSLPVLGAAERERPRQPRPLVLSPAPLRLGGQHVELARARIARPLGVIGPQQDVSADPLDRRNACQTAAERRKRAHASEGSLREVGPCSAQTRLRASARSAIPAAMRTGQRARSAESLRPSAAAAVRRWPREPSQRGSRGSPASGPSSNSSSNSSGSVSSSVGSSGTGVVVVSSCAGSAGAGMPASAGERSGGAASGESAGVAVGAGVDGVAGAGAGAGAGVGVAGTAGAEVPPPALTSCGGTSSGASFGSISSGTSDGAVAPPESLGMSAIGISGACSPPSGR